MTSKCCSQCKVEQVLNNFNVYRSGPREGKYWSQCKSCRNKQLRVWRKNNPDQYRQHYRKAKYKGQYGLSLEEVPEKGTCPICLKEKRLIVDHDHDGPKKTYRGFICINCNTVLGHVENSSKMLRIAEYIGRDIIITREAHIT